MLGSSASEEHKGAGHYGAILTPSFAFGLDVACKNCLWHIEGDRMMWSFGSQIVQYNTQTHEMRFVPLAERGARALVLTVASNFKYFAVAERVPGVEYDQVSIYTFGADKRVKVLPHNPSISQAESSRVEGLHFSENSKYLLVQYGNPDWTLVVWRWYNGKVLASHRMDSRPVLSSCFSPVDDLLLAVLTPTCVVQYRMDLDREVLSALSSPPSWDAFHLNAMCWIAGNMLAVVGAGGEVNVFQEATNRMTTRVEPLPRAAAAAAEAAAAWVAATRADEATAAAAASAACTEHLLTVAARGRGFITAGTSGTVYFFEPPSVEQKRSGIRDLYVLSRRLAVDLPPPPALGSVHGSRVHRAGGGGVLGLGLGPGVALNLPLPPGLNPVLCGARPLVRLSVSAADDELVAISAYGDVAVANMQLVLEREEKPIADVVGPELLEGEPFTRLLGGFLLGRVVGLAAAAAQPLIAAVSSDDRQLRVWNYDARRCVVSLTLEDEPLGLDMHPGGNVILLGLPDKVKMYGILLDALDLQFEVAMKRPTAVRFSTGGALFAYVGRTNAVHLHATYHGQPLLAALKAHAASVNDLRFSTDDRMLVSVGGGGAVYVWDLTTYSRVMDLELVDKQALYCSVAVHNSETGAAVVRASDGRVQQIYNGKVQYEIACRGGPTAPSCLLGADKVFLAADDSGGVVSHAWPSELPPRPGFASLVPPPHTYPLHSALGGGITRMVLVASRGLIFTANGDGTVLMSTVALVLDGILLESTFGVYTRGRIAQTGSRMGSSASQRLLAVGAGGVGATSMSQSSTAATAAAAAAVAAAAVSTGSGGGAGAVSSMPYYITVPEERLLAVREKAIEVAQMVGHAKNDAEYQAFRAAQVLRDTISNLESELLTAKTALAERDSALAKLQEAGRLHERQVVKELEGAHMSAAEELESLYEKRLQVEMERVKVMAAARDDVRYKGEEEIRRLKVAHAREMQELRNHYEAQMAAKESRIGEAAEERLEQDRFFNEYVKQAEEDFEDHSERINKKVHVLTEAAELREQRLKADNNILKRTNLRLKADKTIDMKRMEKLTTDNASLREQTEDLRLTIDKLKKELEERDAVNADNYATVQQLRRKVQELEKHKYVLSYKAESYAKNLEPQRDEIAKLQDALEGHGKELLTQANRTQVLTRHVAEKDAALRTAKASLADFKRRCELQDAAITSFAQELYASMQLPDDRSVHGKSARQKALDELVRKYCLGDPRVNANRNAASEAIATAAAAETRVVLLQWRLDQDARTTRATQRISQSHNSQLLRELQVAQQDNRALRDRVDAAVVALRELQHRYTMLERRAGFKPSRGGEDDLGDGAASGGEDGDSESMSGRVFQTRPVSGTPGQSPALPSSPTGRRTPTSMASANASHRHSQSQTRPGTGGRGFTSYRKSGPAGGGVTGVARGAPLRAFSELLVTERQRMQALAVQLESGAAAVEQQQRALLGLRDQLAAAAAADDGVDDSGDDGAAAADGDYTDLGLGDSDSIGFRDSGGGEAIPISGFGRLAPRLVQANDGAGAGEEGRSGTGGGGGAAGNTVPTGGSSQSETGGETGSIGRQQQQQQQQRPGSSRRVTLASNCGSVGSGGGSVSSYHVPGIPGVHITSGGGGTGGSAGGAPNRFGSGGSSGRPLTASLDSSRRSTASPSAYTRVRSANSGATALHSSTGSPAELRQGAPRAQAGSVGGSATSSSVGVSSAGSAGRTYSPRGRLRPSSAGGVGLKAFTDGKVDRFQPLQPCAEQDLPF